MMQSLGENECRLAELEQTLATGELIAFVGSGASYGVYDEWKKLVRKIYETCCGPNSQLWDEMSNEALMDAAEEAKVKNKNAYNATLGDAFGRKARSRNVYKFLANAAFRSYVTTNFDGLLAEELVQVQKTPQNNNDIIFPFPGPLSLALRQPKTVVHIHGYIAPNACPSDEHPVVLARSEFTAAYAATSTLPNFLRTLLTDYPVCFLGCSLLELPLKAVLDQVQSIRQTQHRAHSRKLPPLFILLEKWANPQIQVQEGDTKNFRNEGDQSQYYEAMGIRVARYSREPDHMGLDTLLRRWASLREPGVYSRQWEGNVQ